LEEECGMLESVFQKDFPWVGGDIWTLKTGGKIRIEKLARFEVSVALVLKRLVV
jgi:hypothetical protein